MRRIAIIGVGRVGGALARFLAETKYEVAGLYGRTSLGSVKSLSDTASIDADIIILSVPDSQLPAVADHLDSNAADKSIILHTSGALASEAISRLRKNGRSIGSMHPLVSLNGGETSTNPFKDAFFGLEGDSQAVEAALAIASALESHTVLVPADKKVLYHAAAVAACGHVTALFDLAVDMMSMAGVEEADRALLPLVESTIINITAGGTAKALTGTFARADCEGFARQLDAFKGQLREDDKAIYLALALRSLDLAIENGAPKAAVIEMRKMVAMAKSEMR